VAKQTHHKHSSRKGYRRLLESLAAMDNVHSVATGRVKPRMGSGRANAPIAKARVTDSGLAITINADGAVIDGYIVTDQPEQVVEQLKAKGLLR
jgi:rhamnogalacturonyl hydrolase YesR